jgi:hypothetical protein
MWRGVRTGLLVSALVLSSLDLHRSGGRHGDVLGGADWLPRATTVSHGGRTPHFCAADIIVQLPCAACIHRLQTSGAHLLCAARPAGLDVRGLVAAGAVPRIRPLRYAPCLARGPPAC